MTDIGNSVLYLRRRRSQGEYCGGRQQFTALVERNTCNNRIYDKKMGIVGNRDVRMMEMTATCGDVADMQDNKG